MATEKDKKTSKKSTKKASAKSEQHPPKSNTDAVSTPPSVSVAANNDVQQQSSANKTPSAHSAILWLAIGLAVVAVFVAGYSWYLSAIQGRISSGLQSNNIQALNTRVSQLSEDRNIENNNIVSLQSRLVEIENQNLRAIQGINTTIDSQNRRVDEKIANADQVRNNEVVQLRTELSATQQSFEQLRQQILADADDWVLQEATQLVLIAQQRLRFFQDPKTAIDALRLANSRLQQIASANIRPVQEIIRQDIEALLSQPNNDLLMTLEELTRLSNDVDSLLLVGDITTADDSALDESADDNQQTDQVSTVVSEGVQDDSLMQSLLSMFRQLVDTVTDLIEVENTQQPVKRILSNEQRQLTYVRAKLLLESAQLALIRQQTDVYQDRIALARLWVMENFQQDTQGRQWLAQLDGLNAFTINSWPDLQLSLSILRQARVARRN